MCYHQVKIICMSVYWLPFMKLVDLEHNSRKYSGTLSTYHRAVCVWSATVCMVCLVCCSCTERASTKEYSHNPTRGPSRDGPRKGTTRSCSCCWCIWVCILAIFILRICIISRLIKSFQYIGLSKSMMTVEVWFFKAVIIRTVLIYVQDHRVSYSRRRQF